MRDSISRRGLLAALAAAVFGAPGARWLRRLGLNPAGAAPPPVPPIPRPVYTLSHHPLSYVTTYCYDSIGRLTAQIDPGGRLTTVTYDLDSWRASAARAGPGADPPSSSPPSRAPGPEDPEAGHGRVAPGA
jgi:YD repeat-containing protein